MNFIICTRDWSGLGFALMLKDEGNDVLMAFNPPPDLEPDKEESYFRVGEGLVDRVPLQEAFKSRYKHRQAYWIFDGNHEWEFGDKLRKDGFKVLGASQWTERMEHDRDYGVDVAKKAGLDIPDSTEFSDAESAIAFLESNENKSYVCKPNAESGATVEAYMTYVPQADTPEDANRELRSYLRSIEITDDFILQEKVNGVEVNVECFFYRGRPFFAHANFESKRKNSGDKGELTGCAQDVEFIVPMDCPLVTSTVGKMFPTCQRQSFTGFGDINCILSDNKVHFIEWCYRFGYNSHPNLFMNLAISPTGEMLSKMMDGKIENFYQHFRKGFGASILMYADHPKIGFPLHVSPEVHKKFYHYEAYQDEAADDPECDYCIAAFGEQIGIIGGFGYTIKDAAKDALRNALKINYPFAAYREDLDESNYDSSPEKRYEAMCAMGLI